uniref:Uncharacterized protein n=1 Tax=Arundo donax TaxID=35708 RepID=A0A0A8XYN0_ARUDO
MIHRSLTRNVREYRALIAAILIRHLVLEMLHFLIALLLLHADILRAHSQGPGAGTHVPERALALIKQLPGHRRQKVKCAHHLPLALGLLLPDRSLAPRGLGDARHLGDLASATRLHL